MHEFIDSVSEIDFSDFFGTVVFVSAAIILTIVLVRFTKYFFERLHKRLVLSNSPYITYASFFKYIALAFVYFVGAITIVSNIPSLKATMASLLAGSGIAALVLGFASQQAVSNIVSGMMVLFFKPFVIGDMIRLIGKDIVGSVEDITLRHTTIKTLENKRIMIPNSIINSEIIENAQYGDDKICALLDIGITYESDIDKAMQLIAVEARCHKDFIDVRSEEEKETLSDVVVRVIALADSSVNLRAYIWSKNNATAFSMKCDLLKDIKKRFDQESIEIAYPHVEIISKTSDLERNNIDA